MNKNGSKTVAIAKTAKTGGRGALRFETVLPTETVQRLQAVAKGDPKAALAKAIQRGLQEFEIDARSESEREHRHNENLRRWPNTVELPLGEDEDVIAHPEDIESLVQVCLEKKTVCLKITLDTDDWTWLARYASERKLNLHEAVSEVLRTSDAISD